MTSEMPQHSLYIDLGIGAQLGAIDLRSSSPHASSQ